MSNIIVNKFIKKNIWPILKEQGFSIFTSRNAWRFKQDTIHIVNFQSFNPYIAGYMGCTTFSFSVNLGIYLDIIPNQFPNMPVKQKDGYLLPEESRCIFRKHLIKSINQEESKAKHIWYIDTTGNNIELAMNDVEKILISDGLKWFEKYSHMDVALNTLLFEEENLDGTWGFGRKDSPKRNLAGGYIALHLKKYDLAVEMLVKAINSGCYSAIDDILHQDCKRINEMKN